MLQGILNHDYETPSNALNHCSTASERLLDILRKAGIQDVEVVFLTDWVGTYTLDFHKYYEQFDDFNSICHYMVRVGDSYIDFTSRQFFSDAPYPTVYTEDDIQSMWANVEGEGTFE